MKIEDVIKTMKQNRHLLGLSDQGDNWNPNANTIACDVAIEALEKQIPKTPLETQDLLEIEYICVVCDHTNGASFKYCWNCGQKLWEDTE